MMPEGLISRKEYNRLNELAREVKPNKLIVEIGAFKGRSTTALCDGSLTGNGAKVVSIDPHLHGTWVDYRDNTQKYVNSGILRRIKKYSVDASSDIPNKSIGLLFIDGGHDRINVHNDILNYMDKLADDAVVLFHDYGSCIRPILKSCPGVFKTVDEFFMDDTCFTGFNVTDSILEIRHGRATVFDYFIMRRVIQLRAYIIRYITNALVVCSHNLSDKNRDNLKKIFSVLTDR